MARPVDSRPAVLITGARGGLAQVLAELLKDKYRLVGVDPRPLPPGRGFAGEFFEVDYRQRKMAEIFRRNHFQAMIHLGRVPVTSAARRSVRYNLNVLGTRNLLQLARKFGVRNAVAVSTFHVYGAHQHNHLRITEEDPLRASQIFAELSDVVELDNVSTIFTLRNPEIHTVVLRPVNVVGPRIHNQISSLLRSKYCPILIGYDPMLQFVHELDVARALSLCIESERSGVYNLAGEGVLPYSRAIELAGAIPVPLPHFLVYPTLGVLSRFGSRFPKHLVDYFRYPTIVSDSTFRRDFGYKPAVSTVEALASLRPKSGQEDLLLPQRG